MFVLGVIGVILIILFITFLIALTNNMTQKRYNFVFFNFTNYLISAIGYVLLYVGYKWYFSALAQHGDILNGMLLFFIGIAFILFVIYYNISHTSLLVGVPLTSIQLVLYAGLALVGIIVLLGAMAFFAEAKPVYRID